MAVTEEEKKQIRAYNIGSLLSIHEPKLLEQIIKSNKQHEFVKMMQTAKDHQEFYQGIPRKDHTREYKNGFYNARALAEQTPELLDQLLKTDTLHKDYLKGLKDGKTEFEINTVKSKIKSEPKPVSKEEQPDYIKGFNQGYQLSKHHPDVISFAGDAQKRWSPYIKGLQAGKEQYLKEQELLKSQPQKSADPEKGRMTDEAYNKLQNNLEIIKDNAEGKLEMLDAPEPKAEKIEPAAPETDYNDFSNYVPDWLRDDTVPAKNDATEPEKDQDQDIEPEL